MKSKTKKIFFEIVFLVVIASAFAVFSNSISEKPLDYIYREKPKEVVDDSVLFGKGKAGEERLETTVSFEQVVKLLDKEDVMFIDARSPENFAEGHIPNAINIFPYDEDQNHYFEQINNLPMDKLFIVYCDGGNCDLSHMLLETMFDFGFDQAFLYQGGWEDWIKNKGPVS